MKKKDIITLIILTTIIMAIILLLGINFLNKKDDNNIENNETVVASSNRSNISIESIFVNVEENNISVNQEEVIMINSIIDNIDNQIQNTNQNEQVNKNINTNENTNGTTVNNSNVATVSNVTNNNKNNTSSSNNNSDDGVTITNIKNDTKNNTNNNVVNVVSDSIVMPDKYNTGATSGLSKYRIGDYLGGFRVLESPVGTAVINFIHAENIANSNVVIENKDFSNYWFRFYTGQTNKKIKIVFNNCKFGELSSAADLNDSISLEFNNCDIASFDGSNATFNKCKFGKGLSDAINPFRNVTINNSYICDIAPFSTEEIHYDGLQIYGKKGIPAENIHIYNTRFEVPYVTEIKNGVRSTARVNAPIMLQLEFSNGNNITFEKIYTNGGGYTIYSHAVKGTSYSNILFKDVYVGYGHLYHEIYPDVSSGVRFENVNHYDKLLVGSVWKDSRGVHISTTNDTLVKRRLTCVTDKGTFNFEIPAHPKLTKENSVNYTFSSMPYDLDKVINDTNIKYVKCYDTTNTNELTQSNLIRTQKF